MSMQPAKQKGPLSREAIDLVLQAMAECQGNVKLASDMLVFDWEVDFDPPSWKTMERWVKEDYAERYQDLVRRKIAKTEDETVDKLRSTALRAAEVEAGLLERLSGVDDKDLPSALRAAADVKAKSVDKLLAMTGRSPDRPPEHSMEQLLAGLAARGLARVNVNLDVEVPRPELEVGDGKA